MGPPIRMGFGDDHRASPASHVSNGYAPSASFGLPQHSPPQPFAQPYQGFPPQDNSYRGSRAPLEPNPFHGHGIQRGRGGGAFERSERGNRGKRDQFNSSRGRYRDVKHEKHGHNSHANASASASAVNHHQKSDGANVNGKKKNKKRKTNTLGLTPANDDHADSEEEDDADEEARLVGDGLTKQ